MFCSLSHSEALQEVVNLVCQQLQTTIKQGNISEEDNIVMLLTALVHLDPFGATQNGEMGFMLIDDILSSSFSERSRYRMASKVVELLGHLFFPKKDGNISPSALLVKPTWIPPLELLVAEREVLRRRIPTICGIHCPPHSPCCPYTR